MRKVVPTFYEGVFEGKPVSKFTVSHKPRGEKPSHRQRATVDHSKDSA